MWIVIDMPYRTPFRFPVSGPEMTIRELKAGIAKRLFLTQFIPADIEVRVSGDIVNDFRSLAECGLSAGSLVAVSVTDVHARPSRSFSSLGQYRADVEARHIDQQIALYESTRRGHLKVIKSCDSISRRIDQEEEDRRRTHQLRTVVPAPADGPSTSALPPPGSMWLRGRGVTYVRDHKGRSPPDGD